MVNGSKIIVQWHINDLMISHVDHNIIEQLLKTTIGTYGEFLAEKTGNFHDNLGMVF